MEKEIVRLLKDIKTAIYWVIVTQILAMGVIIIAVEFLADKLG